MTKTGIKLDRYQLWGLVGALLAGLYIVGYWRSQYFGLPTVWRAILLDLLFCLISVLPLAAFFLLGLPRKAYWAGLMMMLAAVIIGVEGYSCLQEMQAIQKFGWEPGEYVVMNRWPPYGDHQIFFSPGYGWFGRD